MKTEVGGTVFHTCTQCGATYLDGHVHKLFYYWFGGGLRRGDAGLGLERQAQLLPRPVALHLHPLGLGLLEQGPASTGATVSERLCGTSCNALFAAYEKRVRLQVNHMYTPSLSSAKRSIFKSSYHDISEG